MNKGEKYVYTEKLKKERKNRGYSISDMSNFLGFKSKVTYYNIEMGVTEPKISHINKISKTVYIFIYLKSDNMRYLLGMFIIYEGH